MGPLRRSATLLSLLLAAATGAGAQCVLPPLPGPGQTVTWGPADSPVEICADAEIPAGGTVVVQPGVVIAVSTDRTLTVRGTLTGAGTAASPIVVSAPSVFPPALEVHGLLELSFFEVPRAQLRAESGAAMLLSEGTFSSGAGVFHFGGGVLGGYVPPFYDVRACTFDGSAFDAFGYVRLTDVVVNGSYVRTSGMTRFQGLSVSDAPTGAVFLTGGPGRVYVTGLSVLGAAGAGLDLVGADYFIGDDVTLQGNAVPVQLLAAGLLPGSFVPAVGNADNHVLVPNDDDHAGPNVWADVGVPYVVTGNYAQRGGGPLEILPGVTVKLGPNAAMLGDPTPIVARGLPDAPVVFERLDPAAAWTSVTQFSRLENCVIDGSTDGARWPLLWGYIDGCTLRNNGVGAQGKAWIRGSRFLANGVGADLGLKLDLTGAVNPNSFVGNGLAVAEAVDATGNWWGDPSGPTTPTNPGGSGDPVRAGVPVIPFRTAPPDPADAKPVVTFHKPHFVGEPGARMALSWESRDDVAVVGHRILLAINGNDLDRFQVIAEMGPDQHAFDWTVPTVGFRRLGGQFLRVVAIDSAGQEGWAEQELVIPSGRTDPPMVITDDLAGQVFLAGSDIPPVGFSGGGSFTTPYIMLDADGLILAQSVAFDFSDAPFVSTDLARVAVGHQESRNDVKWVFADGYFSIRPDARLGDDPPAVTLLSPAAGSSFPAGSTIPVTWTASDDQGLRSFDLQASYDDGHTWQVLVRDLDPAARSFDWETAPGAGFAQARVRVIARDLHFQDSSDGTGSTFSIVPSLDPFADLTMQPGLLEWLRTPAGGFEDRSATIVNDGTADLLIDDLSTTDPAFQVMTPAPLTVPPGGVQEVVVRFSPPQTGIFEASLEIRSNDPDEGFVQLRLEGFGVFLTGPVIDVSPEALDFGEVTLGSSADLPVTIANLGVADLLIDPPLMTHPAFQVLNPPASTTAIAPGDSLVLDVRFTPDAEGPISGELWIINNDSFVGTVVVPLDGIGASAGAPVLTIGGACPGVAEVTVSGLTPGAPVVLLTADVAGSFVVPGGPCAGTALGLDAPSVTAVRRADAGGSLSLTPTLPAPVCGKLAQAVEAGTCRTSNVAAVP